MKRAMALSIAQNLVEEISPVCDRIQIAGSLRREKHEVKDIEIVAIPAMGETHVIDMFGNILESKKCSTLDTLLDFNLGQEAFAWEKDEELKRWGPRYKRLRHRETGICCDLFFTTERGWGGCLAIRTGPWDFSRALVTLARRQGKHVADGYLIHHHPKPKCGCSKGAGCPLIVPTPEEADFFAEIDLPWIEPVERAASWVWEKAKKRIFREVEG